jgi:hypothetical protein
VVVVDGCRNDGCSGLVDVSLMSFNLQSLSAVEGAVSGAKGIGVDAAMAASAAANGALKAAGGISREAVEQVKRTATGVVAGVKVVVTEPFKKH